MKIRKTSAGLLRNKVEAEHMDRLACTQDALTPKTSKALRDGSGRARSNSSKVRDN